MAVVPEEMRISELRRLGLSEPVIRLSQGEVLHESFRFRCLGPPRYVYQEATVPEEAPFIPLWDYIDTFVGCWERDGQLEFLESNIESDEYQGLAFTEQGYWLTVFVDLYEIKHDINQLKEPARIVGFRFLDYVLDAYTKTFVERKKYVPELVDRIDDDPENQTLAQQ